MKHSGGPTPGQIADIDLRLLRVFRAVVESGGFAAAELELNVGRSVISRHIKDLETRLGLALCRRGRGGFALTPEEATSTRRRCACSVRSRTCAARSTACTAT